MLANSLPTYYSAVAKASMDLLKLYISFTKELIFPYNLPICSDIVLLDNLVSNSLTN
jgi:hypothetical protein